MPRQSALQYLKLHDFLGGSERQGQPMSQDEKHMLSARHLELLANLCDDTGTNAQSLKFWAMCGLAKCLANWGHSVTGFLHGCPCHPIVPGLERQPKRRKKYRQDEVEQALFDDRQSNSNVCPMTGRMAVPLASGFAQLAVQELRSLNIPSHVRDVIKKLNDIDESRQGDVLMEEFSIATSRLSYRMKQSFGYWSELPWALLILMRPYVESFSDAAEAC